MLVDADGVGRVRRAGRSRRRSRTESPSSLMNAEIDATIGPILQVLCEASTASMLSACDGDEPGMQMNLYRWVRGLGLTPRVMGNVKGLQDPYRNPTTQQGFAEQWGQNPAMVTSFADGSKISFEQAIVANATGFKVQSARHVPGRRRTTAPSWRSASLYDVDELRELGGIVDYTVGPAASSRCSAWRSTRIPKQRHYLDLYKMGEGPLYPVLDPVSPAAFRDAQRDRAGRALRGQRGAAARRAGRGGVRGRQARSRGRRDARRLRYVHDLR